MDAWVLRKVRMNLTNLASGIPPATARAVWGGFEVRLLRNRHLELAVVPGLGAKVVSLKNLHTGREWMCHPGGRIKLFRNEPGDDFAHSPLVGWDECLPTITACRWRERWLPDHGEVWNVAWELDEAAWKQGVIQTSVRLPVSPFQFSRALALRDNAIHIDYHLVNLNNQPEEFLWAMHPLLALHPGDRLVLSREIRRLLGRQPWIEGLDFSREKVPCAKAFAGPLGEGRAEIANPLSGDRLQFAWDSAECDTLGIWLTRGGWNGHHHLALEPTNGAHDSLAVAAGESKRCGVLTPFGEKRWSIQIQLQPSSFIAPS
jgi:galactose mutarotase-like enzyme